MADNSDSCFENSCKILGTIVQIEPIRYTPAGFPVIVFEIAHISKQIENNICRDVELNIQVVALGDVCKVLMAKTVGSKLEVNGFLTNRSKKSNKAVLHAQKIDFVE